jgi:protein-L-isoaspartate(D-aspartate) O-methyltransferase
MASLAAARERCVADQIARRGVRDPRVLAAMRAVPRECFVPKEARAHAYDDCPLAIGAGQTISQPYIVAYMIAALQLEGGEKALEIGAGSGYAAAVLGRIAGEVYAVERIAELATQAVANLALAGVNNVRVRHADGTQGWPEAAPFDAILVSAGAPSIPPTLFHQLAPGGRMVVPVGGDPRTQELVRVTRGAGGEMQREVLTDVRFVPLIGREGWEEDA